MRSFVATLLLGTLVASAHGDLVQLVTSRDATLYEDPEGAVSNGGGGAMFAGRNSQTTNSVRRALLAFDIAAAIPPGATITSVSLRLSNDVSNVSPQMLSLHRVSADWGEGSVLGSGSGGSGGPAAPGDATWIHRSFNTLAWVAPGGDFAAGTSAQALVAGPGTYSWDSTPSLVSDVQSFLDQPGTNFGWLIMGGEGEASSAKRFATREEPSAALRPVLSVNFVPAPAGAAALLLAGLAAGVRRRRVRP